MNKKILTSIGFIIFGSTTFLIGIFLGSGILKSNTETSSLKDVFLTVIQASAIVQDSYIEPISNEKLKEHLLSGLVDSLDPHSTYLPNDKYNEMMSGITGTYGGIGISAKLNSKDITVAEVKTDSPANKAGIKSGDVISKINDDNVLGKKLADVFDKIRGPIGSKVKLSILRNEGEFDVFVERDEINIPSVQFTTHTFKGGENLVLKIKNFGSSTHYEMVDILNNSLSEKNFKSIVIDLRDNPGGVISSSIGAAGIFLPQNSTVVIAKDRGAKKERIFKAAPSEWDTGDVVLGKKSEDKIIKLKNKFPILEKIPVYILVNKGSASAAEILAGALKDFDRATIIGNQTFGKGSVQTLIPLPKNQGAIKLTTSRYYTPNGKSIQAVGIMPDHLIDDDNKFAIREADLPKHLKSETEKEKPTNFDILKADIKEICEPKKEKEQQRESTFSVKLLKINESDKHFNKISELLSSK